MTVRVPGSVGRGLARRQGIIRATTVREWPNSPHTIRSVAVGAMYADGNWLVANVEA